jgi:hypothetical protein
VPPWAVVPDRLWWAIVGVPAAEETTDETTEL